MAPMLDQVQLVDSQDLLQRSHLVEHQRWEVLERALLRSLEPNQVALVSDRVQLVRLELNPQAGHPRLEELVRAQLQSQVPEQAQLQSLEPKRQEELVLAQFLKLDLEQQAANQKLEVQDQLKALLT